MPPRRSLYLHASGVDGLAAAFGWPTMSAGRVVPGLHLLYYLVFPVPLWAIDRFRSSPASSPWRPAAVIVMQRYFAGTSAMILDQTPRARLRQLLRLPPVPSVWDSPSFRQ